MKEFSISLLACCVRNRHNSEQARTVETGLFSVYCYLYLICVYEREIWCACVHELYILLRLWAVVGFSFASKHVIVEGMRKCYEGKRKLYQRDFEARNAFLFLCKRHRALLKSRAWNVVTESRGSGVRRKGFVREKRKDFKVKLAILCCVFSEGCVRYALNHYVRAVYT